MRKMKDHKGKVVESDEECKQVWVDYFKELNTKQRSIERGSRRSWK